MNDIMTFLTEAQLEKARQLIKNHPTLARSLILDEVLDEMEPPEGIEREYDEHGRVEMYGGFRAPTLALAILQEFS